MFGNLTVIQVEDLRQIIAEEIEKAWERHEQNMDFSSEESEWLTREEVCDMLHITYTTLWRKENEGVIKKHKMGRRNLYSKKEVESLFKLVAESANI